ncbi:MAG: hypothetical protein Kow00122_15720 [Thermoleophilia bacterium]
MVGSAVRRALAARGYRNLLLRTHQELDLTDPAATRAFFERERPQVVVLAAAKVGGILANWEQPYEFIYQNLAIELSVIEAAFRSGVRRLLFLGSSCIYPKLAPQPLREEYLLTGPLEETNRPYALAKIAGIELCRSLNREYGTDYLSLMPTNLYGPGDNFDLRTSHVLPALIRKFHEAKLGLPAEDGSPRPPHGPVTLWGTGSARREFLHVDDLADALCFLLERGHAITATPGPTGTASARSAGTARTPAPATTNPQADGLPAATGAHGARIPAGLPDGLVNVGVGQDLTVRDLAALVQRVVGHEGEIIWDEEKPDGTPRKLLDVSRLQALGWCPRIGLEEGIHMTYQWYLEHVAPSASAPVLP